VKNKKRQIPSSISALDLERSRSFNHGIKDFVIPTKSLVKIWIAKIFCYNNKILALSTKRLVAAAKFLVAATKNIFVVPDFVAVTKPFFSRELLTPTDDLYELKDGSGILLRSHWQLSAPRR